MQAELKLLGISSVGIHNLSPGMVTTELLMAGESAHLSQSVSHSSACTSRVQCSPSALEPSCERVPVQLLSGQPMNKNLLLK